MKRRTHWPGGTTGPWKPQVGKRGQGQGQEFRVKGRKSKAWAEHLCLSAQRDFPPMLRGVGVHDQGSRERIPQSVFSSQLSAPERRVVRDAWRASRNPDRDAQNASRNDIRDTQNVLYNSGYRNMASAIARFARFFAHGKRKHSKRLALQGCSDSGCCPQHTSGERESQPSSAGTVWAEAPVQPPADQPPAVHPAQPGRQARAEIGQIPSRPTRGPCDLST